MKQTQDAILITGANGGIGKALCKLFHKSGYYVLATDAMPTQQVICDYYIQTDLKQLVAEEKEQDKFKQKIIDSLNKRPLKGLINNAAYQKLDSLRALRLADFRNTLDINVTAPFLLTKLFIEQLGSVKGAVINIGSIHAKLTKPGFVSYATSKAALLGLTQAMAIDLGPEVRVNVIQPAATATEMLVAGFKGKEDCLRKLEQYHPIGRIAEPKEIAELALFLVSEKAGFISGSSINIDGAIGCRLHDPE
jgi:NAD(P)-dependent dehydrogenase (short-subunit alcohol dehydrogenase family)